MSKSIKKSFPEKERILSIHSYEELATLHAIAKILAQPQDLRDQLELVLQEMSSRLGMKRGMISLFDREKKEVWLDIAHDINIEGMDVTYKPGEGITGEVAQTGRPMAVANLGHSTHFLDRTGARRHLNRSELAFLCVPIIYDDQVVGVLSADKVALEVENLDQELAMLSAVAELMAKAVHIIALEEENRRLKKIVGSARAPSVDIIGHSKPMQEVFGLVAQVADSKTTVLITGETGTGKELIARAIHMNSPRHSGPMVQVNCAAIPDTLIESELFGHERGAFTGASQMRKGRFELAHKGTLLIDEVGEIPPTTQVKLLRVIQEQTFERVGGSETIKVDVRLIAATNQNLEKMIEAGTFREDLYYRLNVVKINIPPLRKRKGDIPILSDYFLKKYCTENNKPLEGISREAMDLLMKYEYPGNVRELENIIEQAVVLSREALITTRDLPLTVRGIRTESDANDPTAEGTFIERVEAFEKRLILQALQETNGVQTRAADILGITERHLRYKLKKYGMK